MNLHLTTNWYKNRETHLPTKLTVANLAGTLERYVLDIAPNCGGIAGSDGMFLAFMGDGAKV